MLKLNGIFPPLPTSFDSREELATQPMVENIKAISTFDVAGFLVLGSNGELVHLTDREKEKVYRDIRKAIPSDKIMLAGTGSPSTRQTIDLTLKAADAGANAALVLNPSYYKGLMTQEVLMRHYFAVADASPIPVIVYNMPANSGLDMDARTIVALSQHPNIIGLKDSGGNIAKMGEVCHKTPADFQVLAGSAGFLLPALAIGAIGGILALANIAPQQCIDVHNLFLKGQMDEARIRQQRIIALNNFVTRLNGVPALKEAMDQLGYYGGPSRKPLLPLGDSLKDQLKHLLKSSL
ncbi:MAG: dihydrodipicolinate synthase family protein [Bacteroidales bacterium]|jgi:4-hydroxy-2-oxoglutarate aldolase|nr:dihydrodipicolinate synthase family protein [Bacteroidales bacterium]